MLILYSVLEQRRKYRIFSVEYRPLFGCQFVIVKEQIENLFAVKTKQPRTFFIVRVVIPPNRVGRIDFVPLIGVHRLPLSSALIVQY